MDPTPELMEKMKDSQGSDDSWGYAAGWWPHRFTKPDVTQV